MGSVGSRQGANPINSNNKIPYFTLKSTIQDLVAYNQANQLVSSYTNSKARYSIWELEIPELVESRQGIILIIKNINTSWII